MKKKLGILLIILGFKFYAQTIPTNGLIGRWEFNGNANDQSLSANNGTVYGASLTTDRCGNSFSAYKFNGTSDYIQMPQAGPTGALARSVSFWAKTSNTVDLMAIFGYGSFANSMAYSIHYNYNCLGVGMDVHNEAYTKSASCLHDNNWHHVVVVFNPTVSTLFGTVDYFVDGTLLSSQITCIITGTSQPMNTGSALPIQIGKVHDSNGRFFDGSLDDFYFYNRVLYSSEIQQLHNSCTASVLGPSSICKGISKVFSVSPMPGATSYTWSFSNGWTGTSTSNTILITPSINSGTIQVFGNNSCGSLNTQSSIKSVTTTECLSLNEINIKENTITIFPNPISNGKFFLKSNTKDEILIYDLIGNVLLNKEIQVGANEISAYNLKDAIYFVQLKSNLKIYKLFVE